jgi:hypothetical protein
MIINTGAAVGIAIVTNVLTARHAIHQAQLSAYYGFLDAYGKSGVMSPLHQLSRSLAVQRIGAQAWLFAYHDMYKVLALLILFLAPWCLLLKPASVARPAVETIFD